jgi:hypothetical protein
MNGSCSTSPKEASARGRPASDRLGITANAKATLEATWRQALDEVPDDGSRTPEELAEARAVVALHRACA